VFFCERNGKAQEDVDKRFECIIVVSTVNSDYLDKDNRHKFFD
jgi:hypothetical protein